MSQVPSYTSKQVKEYEIVIKQLKALHEGETDEIAILSNTSALLNQFLEEINWIGFYLWKEDELILGPFQGLPACIRIPYGKGVCGTAIKERKTMRIPDVNEFPGHIVCDSASNSELVIPMFINNEIYGVLDIDSPILNRFDETDQKYLEKFVRVLLTFL